MTIGEVVSDRIPGPLNIFIAPVDGSTGFPDAIEMV